MHTPHFYKVITYENGHMRESGYWWPAPPASSTPAPAVQTEPEPVPAPTGRLNVKPPHKPYTKLAEASRLKMLERLQQGKPTNKEWEPVAALMWEKGMLGYNEQEGYYTL